MGTASGEASSCGRLSQHHRCARRS